MRQLTRFLAKINHCSFREDKSDNVYGFARPHLGQVL